MAKAISLDAATLADPVAQPRAALMPKKMVDTVAPAPPKVAKVPLQILITAKDAKAIKRAALEADLTISDFMISCFNDKMKS